MIFWATFLPYAALSIGLGWVFLCWIKILKPAWIWLTNAIALVVVLSSLPIAMVTGEWILDNKLYDVDQPPMAIEVLVVGLFVPVVLSMVWAGISFVLAWKRSKPGERAKTILIQMMLGPGIAIALGYLIFLGGSIYDSLLNTGV